MEEAAEGRLQNELRRGRVARERQTRADGRCVHHVTDRAMEFFTEKELTAQIGHDRGSWPIATAREGIDNGLDACEAAGTPPVITQRLPGFDGR